MKLLIQIFSALLLLTGCSFFEENATEKLSAVVSLNRDIYTTGGDDEIIASAVVYGGTGNHEIFWRVGDGEYKEGGNTKNFGVYNDSKFQIFTCLIVDGDDTLPPISKRAESTSLGEDSPVKRYGRLQVNGTQLSDSHGFPVQLRGMSTHGIQYYPDFYNENLIQSLAEEWKADVIRISSYVNEGQWAEGSSLDKDNDKHFTYLDDPTYWRAFIDNLVDLAGKHGIYALIDWHMLYPGDPNYFKTEAKEFWKYMVDKHGHKEHVLFDICNEPNNEGHYEWNYVNGSWQKKELVPGKTVTWNMIKKYADEIMPIIREKSDNVAIVGTPVWASQPNSVIGNSLDYSNVMYTMHFYAADHGEDYRGNVKKAIDAGVPIFVTEFGTQAASGDDSDDFVASKEWIDFLNEEMISWVNWNISPDERSGAVFIKDHYPISVKGYADRNKMKSSGKWIMDQIQDR